MATAWQTIDKVNSRLFLPGDNIFFKGGETFEGNLTITSSGSITNRITVSSYGTGMATISCGDGVGIQGLDNEYMTIQNLRVEGSGLDISGGNGITTSEEPGITFRSTQESGAKFRGIIVQNCIVTGCRLGIFIQCRRDLQMQTSYRGYDDIKILNNEVYLCGHTGIFLWAQQNRIAGQDFYGYYYSSVFDVFTNIIIRGNYVHDMYGNIDGPDWTDDQRLNYGTGIRWCNATHGLVEYNKVDNAGHAGHNTLGSPAAFESEISDDWLVQFNEASNCRLITGVNDGAGFDIFDGGTRNFIMQYNYSHDNDGYGCGGGGTGSPLPASVDNHIVRFNVFANNSKNSTGTTKGDINCWGPFVNFKVYNNVFYNDLSGSDPMINFITTVTGYFANNIFVSLGGRPLMNTTTSTNPLLLNNLYWRGSAGNLSLTINGTTYNTLAAFRAGGQETLGGNNYGINADPLLVDPGPTPHKLMAQLVSTLINYDIESGSPAEGAGVSFPAQLGSYPLIDFHGNSFSLSSFNIGAQQ